MEKEILKITKKSTKQLSFDIKNRSEEDVKNGIYKMSFASKTPYLRYFGYEITDPDLMDYSRLNNRSQILFNHNWDDYVGVIEKAYSREGLSIVEFRFGESDLAKQIQKDVDAGILSNVSFGYETTEIEEIGTQDGLKLFNCTTFPYEVSFVTVPADIAVGMKSLEKSIEEGEEVIEIEIKKEEKITEIVNEIEEKEKKLEKEINNLDNIKNNTNNEKKMNLFQECLKIAKKSKSEDLVYKYFETAEDESKLSIEGFKDFFIENKSSAPAQIEVSELPSKTKEKEVNKKELNIGDAFKSIAESGSLTDEQREIQNKSFASIGIKRSNPNAVVLSTESFLKDITVANPASAGVLAQNGYDNTYIANVSSELVLNRLGVRFINARGTGSTTIPVDHNATELDDAFKAEKGDGKNFEVNFSNIEVKPIFIQGLAQVTKEMIGSSSIDITSYAITSIRNKLLKAIETNFLGLTTTPGLLNNPAIPVVEIDELDYKSLVELRAVPRQNKGIINEASTAFLTNYVVSDIFETTPKTVIDFVLSADRDKVAGRKLVTTDLLDTVIDPTNGNYNYLVFGDWSQSAVVVWDGVEVVFKVDFFKNGDALLRADARIGVAIIRPESFVIGKVKVAPVTP